MKNLEQFVKEVNPIVLEQFKISKIEPIDLIGKEVISIRSGFSSGNGGQKMIVKDVVKKGDDGKGRNWGNDYIILKPLYPNDSNENGWLSNPTDFWNDFVFLTDETKKLFKNPWL